MFKGQIEKNTEEFFIEYGQQRTKVKNRIYYNSFSIINERIPNFLKGFEDNIMNCGKSIHFLKLFSPEVGLYFRIIPVSFSIILNDIIC